MRLILACTERSQIRPGVLEAIQRFDPEIRETPGPWGYYELLSEVWGQREKEDLVFVEQDVLIRPECIDEMLACEEDWCKFPYPYPPFGLYGGLGCARFSPFARSFVPDAVEVAGGMHDSTHPPRHWCRLDAWLQMVLTMRGLTEHYHFPEVQHLSDRTDHRCFPGLRVHADIPA